MKDKWSVTDFVKAACDKWPIRPIVKSTKFTLCIAVFIANVAYFTTNGLVALNSPTHSIIKTNNTMIGDPITYDEEVWIGSGVYLAALIAAPVYSIINQVMGRKVAGYLTSVPIFMGWLSITYTSTVTYLYLGRALHGFSLAGVDVFLAFYVAEITEDSNRGALGSVRGVSKELGSLLMYSLLPVYSVPQYGMVSITLAVVFLIIFVWIPDSPMFFLMKEESKKALLSYKWHRNGDRDYAELEMKKLSAVVKSGELQITKKYDLGFKKALLIAVVLTIVMRLCGQTVVIRDTSRLFEISGSSLSSNADIKILCFISLAGAFVSVFLVDWIGRRILLLGTLIIQGSALMVMGICLYLKEVNSDISSFEKLPLVCLCLYCFCVVGGIETLTFVIISETFRPEMRAHAVAISGVFSWFLVFILTRYGSNMEKDLSLCGCYWLYGIVAFIGALFTYFYIPETKRKTLEVILRDLNGEQITDGNIRGTEFELNSYRELQENQTV